MYKRLLSICLVCCVIAAVLTACSDYDETIDTCTLTVALHFPEGMSSQKDGIRVELRSIGHDALFVDSTDTQGIAHFQVIPGIYEASSTTQLTDTSGDTWWQYNFNGVRSMNIVSPDNTNQIQIDLKMSKKRIVH